MKSFLREFWIDFLKLFHASKAASLSLFIVGVFAGFDQLLLSYSLGRFFDALIGARGLRVMTSDVVKWFWLLALVIGLTAAVHQFSKTFTGLMQLLHNRLQLISRIITTSTIGIISVPLHVVASLCVAGFAQTRINYRAKKLAAVMVILLLFAGIYSLFESTVIRDASIGQLIFWSTAIVLLGRDLVIFLLKDSENKKH